MNHNQPASAPNALITPAQFDLIFPFHLVLGRDLGIRHRAHSMARVCPDVTVGEPFTSYFDLIKPGIQVSFEGLLQGAANVSLWRHRRSGLRLRGQFLLAEDQDTLLALWSPWLADNEELARYGLKIDDFALHDPVVDMLQMLQAQKIAFKDVRQLAEKLKAQHTQLRATNEALTLQYSLLGMAKDELKRKEEESRKLAMIAARTDNAVVLTDASGRVEWVNAAFMSITGYTLEDMQGKTPGEVLQGPKSDRWAIAYMHRQLEQGLGFKTELVNYTKSGREYWVQIEVQPITDEQGKITHFMAIERDTTEARNISQSLEKATRQAMAANAAKSEFLANMSHEIRTPMNAVLGLAQMLERETLTANQRDMVRRIGAAGQSLLAIINDILDFSKIEAGQLRVEQRPFDLQTVLASVDALMQEAARAKGLLLWLNPPAGLEGLLLGDALRIEQVLLNLVSNAVKFTPQGRVGITVTLLALTATHARLRFEVQDTGIGIPAEALPTLFTPFTQADSGITRRYGGTGLGLSISKQLIALMGGEIGVKSAPGQGSTFWFELPFTRTTATAPPPAPAPAAQPAGVRLTGLRCLVVDDSRMNLDVVERALRYEGATASLAADGLQALSTLRLQPEGFDIVLMDLQMPVMDGLTALRAIREELGLTRLPLIAFTAGVLAEQRAAAVAAGANDFLSKPVNLEELVAVLQRWTTPVRPATPEPRAPAGPVAGDGLPALPGIDPALAAETLGHDRDFFLELLGRFVREYGGVAADTRAALARGDGAAAAARLHTLRGNAGNLGARDLMQAAQALETAILEQQPTEPALQDFSTALEALVRGSQTVMSDHVGQ